MAGLLFTCPGIKGKHCYYLTINKPNMKNLSKIALFVFAAASLTFASCDSKKAENAENAVEGAASDVAAEADSMATPSEGDTAIVQDQPVQDGVVDSTATK